MSLPRYLKKKYQLFYNFLIKDYDNSVSIAEFTVFNNKLREKFNKEGIAELVMLGQTIGSNIKTNEYFMGLRQGKNGKNIKVECLIKFYIDINNKRYESRYQYHYSSYEYTYEQVYLTMYTDYSIHYSSSHKKYFYDLNKKIISVNRRIFNKVQELSDSREKKLREEAKEKIVKLNLKSIEQGRYFTGRLRMAIFERDNFSCQICNKTKEDGVKLEVDHIKPYSEGGKTNYNNGRVVCSTCNKGLYWVKH